MLDGCTVVLWFKMWVKVRLNVITTCLREGHLITSVIITDIGIDVIIVRNFMTL